MPRARPGKPDPHLEEGEPPLVTTPQGTQEHGVEYQHEEKDVNIGALVRWFTGLAVALAAVIAVMWGTFALLEQREEAKDVMPSEVFGIRQEPPEPRLIPNYVDAEKEPLEPLEDPIEYHAEQRLIEDRELQGLKLLDEKGKPVIPDDAVQKAMTGLMKPGGGPGAIADRPGEAMPSDASGGTMMEDRLR